MEQYLFCWKQYREGFFFLFLGGVGWRATNLSSAWVRFFPFFSSETPLGMPFKNKTCKWVLNTLCRNLMSSNYVRKLTMPSFHFIGVAVIFVNPSSEKVKVFVIFVSSKYGLGLNFWEDILRSAIFQIKIHYRSEEKEFNSQMWWSNQISRLWNLRLQDYSDTWTSNTRKREPLNYVKDHIKNMNGMIIYA